MTSPENPPTPPGGSASGAPQGEDERVLIERCRAGDVAAFEPLVERYRQRVWRLAYQVLRDREEAWDCAQDAFVRAFQSLGSFRGQSAFYTWLFRIAMNVATDRLRSRAAQGRAFGTQSVPAEEWERTAPDPDAQPDQAALGVERRERISRALDTLPPNARAIIMLSDVEGLSYREIASVLNCPIGTVMSRLHNARKRLRTALGPMLLLLLSLTIALASVAAAPAAAQTPAPTPAPAQPVAPPPKGTVHFEVRILQASNPPASATSGSKQPAAPAGPPSAGSAGAPPPTTSSAMTDGQMDERLKQVVPRLRKLFRYSDYTPVEHHKVDVDFGVAKRIPAPDDRWLEVTPKDLQGKSIRMQVRLLKGEKSVMTSNIVAAPGAPAVVGGPRYGTGVLIIILWADPLPAPAAK
ncbi:MAG TPA: sigma-70 family RNA polymerase sigma factor [Candidatus Bathyarchaeia archaeon]|nr:sigma-70 family RNA polymerase sigma factor [Candidatus Bathyarchaeia archaeon]